MSLGELGREVALLDEQFGYFGETIRINPGFSELDLIDFFEVAGRVDNADMMEAAAALKGFCRALIHPADFDLFWSTAKTHRQDTDAMLGVVKAVIEVATARPTPGPSASSDGPANPATRRSSPAGSSSPATRRAINQLHGRPDLQVTVLRAQQSASA